MKGGIDTELLSQFLELTEELAQNYTVQTIVFSCTELHIVNDLLNKSALKTSYTLLDPLEIAAEYIINKHNNN